MSGIGRFFLLAEEADLILEDGLELEDERLEDEEDPLRLLERRSSPRTLPYGR